MNQLTSIASLPSGGGQAQALKAETTPTTPFLPSITEATKLKLEALGYVVEASGLIVQTSKG